MSEADAIKRAEEKFARSRKNLISGILAENERLKREVARLKAEVERLKFNLDAINAMMRDVF